MQYRKTALVTGSSRGIGRAIALRLSDEGFNIVINYSKSQEEAQEIASILKSKERPFIVVEADVSKESAVKKLINSTVKVFGGLDVLVNNAGINQTTKFDEIEEEEFSLIINTNLKGAYMVTRHALPFLKKSKDPRVIFIASTNAFTGSLNRAAYTVSKNGLVGLMRALALELAPKILVNVIVPGYIETDMFRKFTKKPISGKLSKIPLGRLGKPEDVANVVAFLISADSSYITGQCIHVNGGYYLS